MRYFQKRKHLLSSRIIVYQKAFEELQISCTCSDPSESPIVLIPFDVKVCDTSEDIQDEISDQYVSVTVASVPPSIQEYSKNQLSRFTTQRFLTGELLKKIIERDEEELVILSNIVETASQHEISSVMKSILQFRVMLYMPLLVEKVIT